MKDLTDGAPQVLEDLMETEMPPSAAEPTANGADLPGSRKSKLPENAADRCIAIALRCDLFHDERNDSYAAWADKSGVRRVARIGRKAGGRDFCRYLAHTYFKEHGQAPGGEAISMAIQVADAKAANEGACHPLDVRFQVKPDGVWLDLVDNRWRAIRVTADSWQIVERPPILFRRFSHEQPMPIPLPGGDFRRVFEFLNLKSEADRVLALAWLATAPMVNVPRPALILHGIKGSCKTCGARVLRQTVDPSVLDGLVLPRKPDELAQVLDHHAVACFDNLTRLQAWQADVLCAAVTGGAFAKRELYTDTDDILMNFKRTFIITGINVPTAAPDFLDRSLLIELSPPAVRLAETDLSRRLEEARPEILGGLLDTLVGAMRRHDGVSVPMPSRMADFERWGAAVAETLGYGAECFLEAYARNRDLQVEEVLEGDSVAAALRDFVADERQWKGTAKQLLDEIGDRNQTASRARDWPQSPERLGRLLRILQPTLAEAGVRIELSRGRGKRGRVIGLWAAESVQPEEASRDD